MNSYGIYLEQHGAPNVLRQRTLQLTDISPQEVRIKHISIGLNFIDTYHRSGLYPVELPTILGAEAVGIIEEVGTKVKNYQKGDIVGYCTGGLGAYATHRNILASKIFPIPEGIDPTTAASFLLKGLTVEYLIKRIYPVKSGETVLFHAIAGGVGSIACQWLKKLGVKVIGTVSNSDKADYAHKLGCDHVIRYDQVNVAERVREITNAQGVPVVFDGVGQQTFLSSLDCLQPRGLMVSFGNASGAVEAYPPSLLASKGSIFLTRPTLGHYTATESELQKSAKTLFSFIKSGFEPNCNTHYALKDIVNAHTDLAGRKIIGSAILRP